MNTTDKFFISIGFICAIIILVVLTFYLFVTILDAAFRKTKLTSRVFKVMMNFYQTLPKQNFERRYVIAVFDWEKRKFIDSQSLNAYGETDEEYIKYFEEMKQKHARNRG